MVFEHIPPLIDLPILMYHRVCCDNNARLSEYIINRSVFRRQMQYLHGHHFYTPRFADMIDGKVREASKGMRPVVITFDDGYLENFENAVPVLCEFGYSAIMFLLADSTIRMNMWDDEPALKDVPLVETTHAREMVAAGMEIGSHGFSHHSLVSLGDRELERELADSKRVLEDSIHSPASYLAYPYGDVDSRVKRATARVGYTCGFASRSGPLHYLSDLFEIRRIMITRADVDNRLGLKLSGIYQCTDWGRWTIKRALGMHNAYHGEITSKRYKAGGGSYDQRI